VVQIAAVFILADQFDIDFSGQIPVKMGFLLGTGVTAGWPELHQLNAAAHLLLQPQTFSHIAGGNTATPYFRPQLPHELEFATDTFCDRHLNRHQTIRRNRRNA
jgi:hypothetical protein